MARFVVARQLGGKRAITTTGKEIGRLDDIIVDEATGEMEHIVVEPDAETAEDVRFSKDGQGDFVIPFKAVRAISDVIVVEESVTPAVSVVPVAAPRHYHGSRMVSQMPQE
jgi:sporulation protein YlmC with PRC-barrel domain